MVDLLQRLFEFLLRRRLPPIVSMAAIGTAMLVVSLPVFFPVQYFQLVSTYDSANFAQVKGDIAREATGKIAKKLQETEQHAAALEEALRKSGGIGHEQRLLKVVALFATPIQEAWDGAIHQALKDLEGSKIEYCYEDNVRSSQMAGRARAAAAEGWADLIVGDAFGAEDDVRRVALDFDGSGIRFAFGSAKGPSRNFAVFDNWIHEPAHVAGMIAAALSRDLHIGIVAAKPIAEVNRLLNAFIVGAKEIEPGVRIDVRFINDFHKPELAYQIANELIESGADVIYAERDGAIAACERAGVPAIGNIQNQSAGHAGVYEQVVTNVIWDMAPTMRRVIRDVELDRFTSGGDFFGQDYGDWSRMYHYGSRLENWPLEERWQERMQRNAFNRIADRYADIHDGRRRVQVIETDPSMLIKSYQPVVLNPPRETALAGN